MAILQSSVPLPEQLWFSSSGGEHKFSKNQVVLGGLSAGGNPKTRGISLMKSTIFGAAKDGYGYL